MSQALSDIVIKLTADNAEFRRVMVEMDKLSQQRVEKEKRAAEASRQAMLQQAEVAKKATRVMKHHQQSLEGQTHSLHEQSAAYRQKKEAIEALNAAILAEHAKNREAARQAKALAQAQEKHAEAFFKVIDSVAKSKHGYAELLRLHGRVREAYKKTALSQKDYLALISDITEKRQQLTRAEAQAEKKKRDFIRQLKREITEQKRSHQERLRLKAAELGVSSAAEVYIRQLNAAGRATQALGLKSAGARREIGVLIGEIARGDFGALSGSGITLANRAGWLDKLVSLRGLGIAGLLGGITSALYGVGKAWYEGSKEASEFNQQLILTGRYAGKTTEQLMALAKSMAVNGITQHDASGALAAVVGSGAFTRDMTDMVARTAAKMEYAVGQSVDETINQFKRLAQDPVSAAKELDKSLHFLTAAQLEHIQTLSEQGRTTEATKIAMAAYSAEMNRRADDIIDSLGWLEIAWKGVGDAAKWAWDHMLDIGRPDTLEEKIAKQKEAIRNAARGGLVYGIHFDPDAGEKLQSLEAEKFQQDLAKAQEQAERTRDELEKRRNEDNRALNRKNETEAMRHQRELQEIKAREYADQEVRNAAIERENQRHQQALEQQNRAHRRGRQDEATRLLMHATEKQARLQAEIEQATRNRHEKLTDSEKQLVALKARISQMSGKLLTDNDKSLLAHQRELELALENNAQAEKALRHQKALNDLKKETLQLQQALSQAASNTVRSYDAELAKMRMGNEQQRDYDTEQGIKNRYDDRLTKLQEDSQQNGTYGSAEYQQAEQALREHLDTQLANYRQHQQQMKAAQSDWTNGASRAVQNFVSQGQDMAGMTERVFSHAFQGMGQALGDFVTKGQADFKALTASILSDLAKMALQIALSKALGALFGGVGVAGPVAMNAQGGVYTAASLSRYSGTMVNRPTLFAFAKGAGLMGEAGPEAILPLRRNAQGKLGVMASVAGQRGDIHQTLIFHVKGGGENGLPDRACTAEMATIMKQAIRSVIREEMRDGGMLSNR
ncbi:TPA: phage tail tape measure protein [Providencia alcalifaciens]